MRFVARSLVLVSAVALALPPEWCCLLARAAGCPEFAASVQSARAPACHRRCPFQCGTRSACPRPCPPQRPCRNPCSPCYWLCVGRIATPSPDGPEAPGPDLSIAAPLPPVAVPCPRGQLALAAGRPEAPAPDPPPVNVLHCTWLC